MDIITTVIYIALFIVMMVFVFSIGMLKQYMPKREVLLSEETDDDGEQCDTDLRRSGVPTHGLNEDLESKVVNCQINCHDHDVANELACAMQR